MTPKKSQKSDLNKKTHLFLQIGLILVLFISWQGMEYTVEKQTFKETLSAGSTDDFFIEENVMLKVPTPEPVKIPEPKVSDYVEIVPDEHLVENDFFKEETPDPEEVVKVDQVTFVKPVEKIEVPSSVVEEVPIFPGCENLGTRSERETCMNKKIQQLVARKFDPRLGAEMGLEGTNRIYVTFKVNELGEVVNVRSKGKYVQLEQEAERVVKLLPKMIPGRQGNRPVGVLYSIPIVLQVD